MASIDQPKDIGAVHRDLSPRLYGGTKVWGGVTHTIRWSNEIHTNQRYCLVLDFPDDFKDMTNRHSLNGKMAHSGTFYMPYFVNEIHG